MSDTPIFDFIEQQQQLHRVSGAIANTVLEFFDSMTEGQAFTNRELHDFCGQRCNVAPGSADRVMRSLKKAGMVNYEVVNRNRSTYCKRPLEPTEATF